MKNTMEVLIVEDEMLLAMDIEAIVEDTGHHVLAGAASLQDVKALPEDLNPQLAFVDMHLALNSNGTDVCEYILAHWPDALVIFVTANVSKIPADYAGAHGVIAKPFSHAGVVNAINYLANLLFDPPPSTPRPASLIASANLERFWAKTPN